VIPAVEFCLHEFPRRDRTEAEAIDAGPKTASVVVIRPATQ
jgi:hypothetical protein